MNHDRMRCAQWVIAIGLALLIAPASASAGEVNIVVGPNADALERYAADQLSSYVERLFGIQAKPVSEPPADGVSLLVGSPASNPAIAAAVGAKWPKLSDQGIVLMRAKSALVVGGNTPRATLWAVSELAERWGVTFLLHGDVLPEKRAAFRLPEEDIVREPVLRVRQWRMVNDFACGPEGWGAADYHPVIDQLAKLRFNRLYVRIEPHHPFLDLKFRGIERKRSTIFYGSRFPITADMIGRQLFAPDAKEFWNPDLAPADAPYAEQAAAGERYIHALMDYAHHRGMQCVLTAAPLEFPAEFAPLVKTQAVQQVGALTVVPSAETSLDDPVLNDLSATVLRTTVDTYPEADFLEIGMPEHRQWYAQYEQAWKALDDKYHIGQVTSLADVINATNRRADYPGGVERAVREVKGDIVALRYYDRLFNERHALKGSRRPDVKLIVCEVAEELFPILSRVLPPGSETMNTLDYTPSRVLKRREVLSRPPGAGVPSMLIVTLHDDNIGLVPQVTTPSLYELTKDLRAHGWAGFSTRYWLIGDHDASVTCLARGAWDGEPPTPEAIYRAQARVTTGPGTEDEMVAMFREIEAATLKLEWDGLGMSFPVPGLIVNQTGPMPESWKQIREDYRRALGHAKSAKAAYWIGRLEFGIAALDAMEAVRNGDREAARTKTREAIEAYARVAQDQSDRGAIAMLNEFTYRPLSR